MQYLTFGPEQKTYKICILVNEIRKDEIIRSYIKPYGLNENEIIVINLHRTPDKKKTPSAEQKTYIVEELGPTLIDLGVEIMIVGDGDYFKTLTKSPKVDPALGYMKTTEFGPWKVTYVPNFRTIFSDPPKINQKIATGINAVTTWMDGSYKDPGIDIIKFSAYPDTVEDIAMWLDRLLGMDCDLTIDIEAFSLKHYDAGIGTISFAWSKTEGIAFPVDILDDPEHSDICRELLRDFFMKFKRKAIYHRIWYDVYVLIYQLFMKDILDNEGLLRGLDIMLRNWDCTQLISYLATNSCAGNELGLKIQAQDYAGNYAQEDIKDIRKIPLPELLQYNLLDTLSTWYVHEKHWPTVVADDQVEIYETIFKPAIKDIIQMQLTGLPIDMEQVKKVKVVLEGIKEDAMKRIELSSLVQAFQVTVANEWATRRNTELKVKRVTPKDFNEEFNPGSPDQLVKILYDTLGLPIISRTKTKAPSTGGKVLTSLLNHTEDPQVLAFLSALIDFKAVDKIIGTFIVAFETSVLGPDGWYWLFGNFNLGGTVSGRLSSSGPNMQNLPANVEMILSDILMELYRGILAPYVKNGKLSLGKIIKSCIKAPPGWFFCGIDFSSLEDKISALTTKDPQKLKVYTDGFDGHSLRAVAYFGDQMPDIDPTSVTSINSLSEKGSKYAHFRRDSKTPTFLLTYGGTHIGIVEQLGWTTEKAIGVETKYHMLYKVSDDWIADKLNHACHDGYVTVAFGLRVRTPKLKQVIRGTSKTPFMAEAEGRTAGNALGQSWGLLNSRAASEFMVDVRVGALRNDIKPSAHIHDAQYYLLRDNIDVVHYTNTYVVKACQWQNHPDIWHDEVKLGGEFGIFYPDWSHEAVIPNDATREEIWSVFTDHVLKLTP